MLSGDDSLAAWEGPVLEAVADGLNARTGAKFTAEGARLIGMLRACGAEHWDDVTAQLVRRWFWTARPDRSGRWREVAPSTAYNRRAAAKRLFEAAARLGAPIDPAALVGDPIARSDAVTSTRPLTDKEARLVRAHAHTGLFVSRRLLLVALAFAGGTATEIALVRLCDLDVAAGTVALRGRAARTNPLGPWPAQAITKWLNNQHCAPHPDTVLCVSEDLSVERAAHCVTVRLGDVLRDAGLRRTPGVTARSLRLTTAAEVFEESGLIAAARFLGSLSLDSTAAALNFDWRRDV